MNKMKVDTNRLKKGTSELTPECRQLIEELTSRKSRRELLEYLEKLRGWVYGKCELYHWIDVLDRFDDILAEAAQENPTNEFSLFCDTNYTPSDVRLLLYVINFTTLLIEHSFSRHLYNSIEYLTQLLSSTNMDVVMCVLNLLYMFSKRSNFIPRLNNVKKVSLLTKLYNFAESWGGKDNGFSLAQCCTKDARLPISSSTLYFEFYNTGGKLDFIEVPGLDKIHESAASIAKVVCDKIPHLGDDQRMHILTRIRLAASFRDYRMRLQFVQARLQAISVLVYSNALQDNIHTLLYPGFLEELVELLEMKQIHLVEIRAAALRTLTSIIHLDRNPHHPKKPGSRLSKIIEVTGAALYHGFLPTLVRACISHLISIQLKELDLIAACSVIHQYTFPLSLATALFSFLYHLASYEAGGEALVSCGMMESLLRVINWPGVDLEHITFVTRAVRVIDLITNIDMHSFHNNNGLAAFIQRLETEVNHCRQVQLTMRDGLKRKRTSSTDAEYGDKYENAKSPVIDDGEDSDMTDAEATGLQFEHEDSNLSLFEVDVRSQKQTLNEPSTSGCSKLASTASTSKKPPDTNIDKDKKVSCVTQRAALLKSMLNFLKKSIQDNAYNSGMRNVMETSLPRSLRNIISNAEYYGPSLFLLATDVVTVYVFQEPSLLCTLQDSGLTDIVLQSLLRKEVPATREVLGSLPNVFSALCLNARGLQEFASYRPFDRLFQVLLSPDYLVAMRRRRSSDPLGDTATNLGNAMDDLMKHHPSLRTNATKSIIKLLIELVRIGSDPRFICWRANNSNAKAEAAAAQSAARSHNKDNGNGSSGDDDDDDEISTPSQQRNPRSCARPVACRSGLSYSHATGRVISIVCQEDREPVPLIDYILNVMKFLDAIISNGTNGEHCREFVTLGGLQPLLSILSLPNLPVDSPVTTTAQAVATVCKSILNLAHETKVIEVAILQLSQIVEQLKPLVVHMNSPEGSILLKELSKCPKMEAGFSNAAFTPLLHAMSAVHGYVVMLVHICRSSQNDVRILLLRKWGIDCARGKKLLQSLVQLYTSLVWESTILLGMCSEENAPKDHDYSYDEAPPRPQTETRTANRTPTTTATIDIDDGPTERVPTEILSSTRASTSGSTYRSASRSTSVPTSIPISTSTSTSTTFTSSDFTADFNPTAFTSSPASLQCSSPVFPLTFGSCLTSASTPVMSPPSTSTEDNMDIDDDVICLTPLPPRQNAMDVGQLVNQAVNQIPVVNIDETISIDSNSSDSVVYISALTLEQRLKQAMERRERDRYERERQRIESEEREAREERERLERERLEKERLDKEMKEKEMREKEKKEREIREREMKEMREREVRLQRERARIMSAQAAAMDEAEREKIRREKAAIRLRFIKALLAASSRLGRALAELFGNLVKLCVGSPSRQRRANELLASAKFPYMEAGEIARVLSYILVNGFCYDKIVTPSVPKLKLTFLICSVGFTGPMLFDEKRYAFHLMLSQFCEEGGLEAFFDMFRWALSYGCEEEHKETFINGNEYAEGTGEFLDAWLLLLEKMVNPRAIFESPHFITSRPSSGPLNQLLDFEPVFYLVKVHSLALDALCTIWDKKPIANYGIRMAESIIAIMKHIIKNEATLREKFEKRKDELRKIDEEEAARQAYRESIKKSVNLNHLKLFMDMGFSEAHVSEALANTNSVEQATDFLLNRPESNQGANAVIALPPRIIAENDDDDDDADDDEEDDDDDEEEDDDDDDESDGRNSIGPGNRRESNPPAPALPPERDSRNKRTWKALQLTDPATVSSFCREAFDKTFNAMDLLPETVTSGADLLAVLYRSHSPEMRHKFLMILVQNITDWTEKILHNLKARDALNSAKREEILVGRYGLRMFIRMKVGCLLLSEMYRDMRKAFVMAIRHEKSLSTLIMLLHKIESILQEQIALGAPPITPRWLQHLIEFIDSIDNACLIMQRKANMIAVTTNIWKWFDSSAGKWNAYSSTNNGIIHNAFVTGERSVRITCGRQKYTINFNCMSQVNEATGNHRPVIPELKITELTDGSSKIESSIITSSTSSESDSDSEDQSETAGPSGVTTRSAGSQAVGNAPPSHSSSDGGSVDSVAICNTESAAIGLFDIDDDSKAEDDIDDESESGANKVVLHEEPTGLQQYDTGAIVSCLVRLMRPKLAIDLDTINSLLKLCVRLTKDYESAKVFVHNGGIKLLLNMRQMCGYMTFPTYAIILIRHVLEEPHTLLSTMERVIATRTISAIPSGHRDIVFVLRQMSSAVARDPKMFIRAATNVLRLDCNMLKGKTDCYDDTRLIVKTSNFFRKLGQTLPAEDDMNIPSGSNAYSSSNDIATSVINDLLKALVLPCSHFPAATPRGTYLPKPPVTMGGVPVSKNAFLASDGTSCLDKPTTVDDSQSEQCCAWHIPSCNHLHDKPLLTRATILKILADAVRSYQTFVPRLITEHVYTASDSALIEEDQTALSFILDILLPLKENSQEREVNIMSRVLITALCECVDQLAIQNAVIIELKAAMKRAINLPESVDKHNRLQVFVSLLPTMIDNPPPLNKITPHRNEVFLLLLRKGIMTDLAKMILFLDLSNPSAVPTLNAILKPMETLLRLTIAPCVLAKKKAHLQSSRRSRDQPSNAAVGRTAASSGRHTLSRRTTNGLDGEASPDVLADRRRATGFFFTSELARTGDQFNHIFDGILENDQEIFNAGAALGRNQSERHINEGLNDNDSPNADVAFETSSESSDSESNASEENEERDGDDEDGNEDPAEDRSEADAEEETRHFIEVFDHVYAPDQPRTSSNDRHLDGVPIIRYTVSANLNASGSGTSSSASTSAGAHGSGGSLVINDNRISGLVQQARHQRNTNAGTLSRSFNTIQQQQQQQRPSINIGIIRSAAIPGAPAVPPPVNSNSIDDDLIARFNYYIHHGQSVIASGNLLGPPAPTPSGISNIPNSVLGLGVANGFSANASTSAVGIDSAEGRTANSNGRLQRDSRRLLFVDQQYCTPVSFNNTDESQNELFNQDALHWWLEEAKNLDMESQPDICLTVAHQIIPELRELRDKTKKRKRNTTFSIPTVTAGGSSTSAERQDTTATSLSFLTSSTSTLFSNSSSHPIGRRSAIPVLVHRNADQRDVNPTPVTDNAPNESPNVTDEGTDNRHNTGSSRTLRARQINTNVRRSPRTQINRNSNTTGISDNSNRGRRTTTQADAADSESDDESDEETQVSHRSTSLQTTATMVSRTTQVNPARHQSQQTVSASESYSADLRHRLQAEIAEAALVPLPDDDDDEEDDDEEDDEDQEDEDRQDNDENEDNDDDEEEEDDEDELNVEDVIMDFDDEIQNVLSQFSATVRPQESTAATSVASSTYQRVQGNQTTRSTLRNPDTPEAVSTVSRPTNVTLSASISTATNTINTQPSSAANAAARTLSAPGVSGVRTSTSTASRISEMSAEVREALGDLHIPEGVDPSFLAALPSEMREEVIQEHLRAQRNRQRAQQNAIETEHESLIQVNADFLAALPPNIQAEVLSQQRIEQQRQAAQTANPDDPVDAVAFFENLQPSLRQAILTDMEDSQIASLPPELVAEAQNLRRDWEHRNRQVQDRLANQSNSTPSQGGTAYIPPRIPTIQNLRDRPSWHTNSIWYNSNSHASCSNALGEGHSQQQQGKPVALALMENEGSLLDVDALACLLLMLFIEDPKFNLIRLHRVIRHLCYHTGTREWIINSLIAIIKMADEIDITKTDGKLISEPQHLTLRVDSALGYRTSVFLIKRGVDELFTEEPYCGEIGYSLRIHPQAAHMACRNSLDLLITLARHFPKDFVPFKRTPRNTDNCDRTDPTPPVSVSESSGPKSSGNTKLTLTATAPGVWSARKAKKPKIAPTPEPKEFPAGCNATTNLLTMPKSEFLRLHPVQPPTKKTTPAIFDVLLKLDCTMLTYQPIYSSKDVAKMFVLNPQPVRAKLDFISFEDSPFAQLLSILPSTVIKRSQQLTDKLVRLLSSLGMELPKEDQLQPFNAEDDPIDIAELSQLEQPSFIPASTISPIIPVLKPNKPEVQPTPTASKPAPKTARVIDVHDSESEPEESEVEEVVEEVKPKVVPRSTSLYPYQAQQLKIAIEVLTTKSCSEEGLEYATELIVHLSQCSSRANAIVVQLLIRAILGLAELVRKQIINLMKEVKQHNTEATTRNEPSTSKPQVLTSRGGTINDRFTAQQVIISTSTKGKPTCELQLVSMAPLLIKSSSQAFFLRTLKVFMQVRDLIEYKALLTLTEIEPLSEVICLDELWNTLSECLVDLEMTNDQHAVLILQPAVEAFFLIHASKKKPPPQAYRPSSQTSTGRADTFTIPRHTATTSSGTADNFNIEGIPSARPVTDEESMDHDSNDYLAVNPTPSSSSSSVTASCSAKSDTAPSTSAAAAAAVKEADIQRRDEKKFLEFAEKHRTVLNQILRQSATHLSDGPFSVLVDHTRILDFDVKRKYFRTELERMDEGIRREELTVNVRRVTVFEDSFRELYRRGPEEWKNRFYIVFEDEEGQDAGGLLREWYVIISREIFNPMYALFCVSPGDRVTYMINPSSHANPNHLCYFKFVGRVIAKAIHDNKLLECYFTRSFYKHILGIQVKYTDMESQDYDFYKGLAYLMNNDVSTLGYDLTFSTEVQEFGVTQVRDLIPNGRNMPVTEKNKLDYIRLVCQLKMSGSIRQQLNAFLDGFYDIIPKRLISIFNEQELELLISGLPNVDIEDLKQNTEYHKYNSKSPQIQWFWRALRSFDQADRAKFLQFVTGTSKVPLQGFSALEGMNGIQKFQIHRDDRSTDRLPCAHTCFNQLDLPLYKSFEKLRTCLTKAIHECSEGFGFA